MYIEKQLDRNDPIIYGNENGFNIQIGGSYDYKDIVVITFSCNDFYCTSEPESIKMNIDDFLNLLIDYKKEIQRRQIEGNKA